MNRLRLSKLATLIFSGALLVACSQEEATTDGTTADNRLDTRIVTIATGGASGPYNIIGTALGESYVQTYGVNSRTQTTGASVENVNLIDQGKVELAFIMSDVLSQAVNGEAPFPKKIDSIYQVAAMYDNYMQIVTSKSTGIKTMDDLRGKRVAVGDQNSGTEVNARTLLAGHGITYDDIRVDYLGFAEAADALRAGRIDAAVLSSGMPNASIMELEQNFDLQIVSISPERIDEIAKDKSYFHSREIPAGTYGNEEPIPTAVITNAFAISAKVSDDDAYKLTKTFFESLDNLKNAHQAASHISYEHARTNLVAPLHPGAERYYNEMDAKNSEE